MQYGLVFLFGVVFDIIYVEWTLAAVAGKAGRAAIIAGAITAITTVTTLMFVATPLLGIPAVLGHSLGSYLAIKRRSA